VDATPAKAVQLEAAKSAVDEEAVGRFGSMGARAAASAPAPATTTAKIENEPNT
jgi:hypothetical protein